jgi:ubiquinone/menaquinone biosynthesis C-methylase UbiE
MKKLALYCQYKNDIFNKLGIDFEPGKKILDVGCGDGSDAEIFINHFDLNVYGVDIYKDKKIENLKTLIFKEASIYRIPFVDDSFDYVFCHDVLHHIDEKNQAKDKHLEALCELRRVVKDDGRIIIVESNRYNPLSYPHMVIMMGHNHWRQSYFKKIISEVFTLIEFKSFEVHAYPKNWIWFWKSYELLMEKFFSKFLDYNVAIIKK